MITHVDRDKKNSPYYRIKTYYFFFGWLVILHADILYNNFKYLDISGCSIQKSYLYRSYFCKFGNMLRRSCLWELPTQIWGGLSQGWVFSCVVRFTNSMHACYFTKIVGRQQKIKSLTVYANPPVLKSVTSGLRSVRLHSIGNVVLNKLTKCEVKTQNLLASTPCSHKSHMLVTVHVLWCPHNNKDGSTCKHCKTPEQPLSHRTSRQLNVNATLKLSYK